MANIIRIKRGLKENINNVELLQGELAIATDTQELFVGNNSGIAVPVKAAASGVVEEAERLENSREISVSGDASGAVYFDGSSDVDLAITLATSGVTAGTYTKVTVDSKGRVTTGANLTTADLPTIVITDVDGLQAALNAKANSADLSTVATSGSYNDLSNKPTIPDVSNFITKNVDDLTYYTTTADLNTALADKVDKVSGKQLSTNDFTTALKDKLDGIAAGAEVNVNADWTAASGDAQILNKPTTISGFGITDAYTKTEVDTAISTSVASAYKYKGSVTTYNDLPSSGMVTGDVYNIVTADSTHGINAGDNVAWTGSAWDKLAGTVDLSAYDTAAQVDAKYVAKVSGKGLSTNDYTTAEQTKLYGIETGAEVNVIESVKVNGTAQTVTNKAVDITVPTSLGDLDPNAASLVHDASYVHTDNNYTTSEKTKLTGVDTGAQVNVIETVKVNSVAQTVTNKAVDITVPTATSQLTNDSGFLTSSTTIDGGTF